MQYEQKLLQPYMIEPVRAHDRKPLRDDAVRVLGRKDALSRCENGVQKLREAPKLVGVKDAVNVAIALFDALCHGRLPHHAAAEEDFLRRMAVFCVRQRADVSVDAVFGVLSDGAGIDDDAVRALLLVYDGVAAALQHPADALGIRLVLLAAIGIDHRTGRAPLRLPVRADFFTDLLLGAKLLRRDLNGFAFHGISSDVPIIS